MQRPRSKKPSCSALKWEERSGGLAHALQMLMRGLGLLLGDRHRHGMPARPAALAGRRVWGRACRRKPTCRMPLITAARSGRMSVREAARERSSTTCGTTAGSSQRRRAPTRERRPFPNAALRDDDSTIIGGVSHMCFNNDTTAAG